MSEEKNINTNPEKKRKRFLNSLSKKLIIMFIIMTILISISSCIIGYIKYSSTIKQLYNENSYSIANIVKSTITPEMGDFLESLIVYETDAKGNYILNSYGHKIPKLIDNNGTKCAEVNFDMYADPATLSGEQLENYNKYYDFLDTLDLIRKESGAKYIFLMILCDGDYKTDPYYVEGQEPFENPYGVYFADARVDDETLKQINLSDPEIIASADSYGVKLTEDDLRDENGELYDWVYNNFCRLGVGQQTRCAANIYQDALATFLTDIKSDNYFENNTDYGMTTEAILPFKNSEGRNVGILSVDVEMSIIQSTLRSYIFTAILATVALVLLFMLAFLIFMERKVVKPIKEVTVAATKFIDEDMSIDNSVTHIKTGDEIEELATSFTKMSADLVEYVGNLAAVTAEKERIGAELNVASHIQSSMLPCIFPAFPERKEIDVYATMNPAKEVGGDFYDFFMVDDRHIAMVMADVSGKGVPAALFMVIGKTLIKDHTVPGSNLSDVFATVNNMLCEANSQELFITAFEGVLDLVTGEFSFVNAGHEMPFISRAGGAFEPYKIKPGFVLAGMENMRFTSGSIMLEPGDKVFQYTDGVTEATNSNNELFGMERLQAALSKACDGSPYDVIPAVKMDVDAFVGEAPQFDDITMLCLEYKERMEIKDADKSEE